MEQEKQSLPVIFEYDDFRRYLKDFYKSKKELDPSFSLRSFAQSAGYRAPSTLKRVIEGERNLSLDGILKFSKALNLNKEETLFFKNLVFFNQAKTPASEEHFAKKILTSKTYQKLKPLAQDQFYYWSCWFNLIIRELITLPGFKENSEWIAKQIIPPISSKKVSIALKKLLKLGILKRDQEGNLKQTDFSVTSGDQVINSSFKKYHRQMIQFGKESITRFSKEERHISSLTVTINKEKLEKLKVSIAKFRKEILGLIGKEGEDTQVYQINFQVFPVSQEQKIEE